MTTNLLRAALHESESDDIETFGWRRILLSNIRDLYYKLGQLSDAQNLLVPELKKMRLAKHQDIDSSRRLQLTLAESFTRSSSYQEADDILDNVERVLEDISDSDDIAKEPGFVFRRAWPE